MKIFPLSFLFIVFLVSCTSKYGIVKAEAFSRKVTAGTIRTDENGNPRSSGVSKHHLIYIETDPSKPAPEWSTVWVEQQPYSVRPVEVPQSKQPIGKTAEGKKVVLNSKKGNRLWQLVLSPKTGFNADDASLKEKIEKYPIVLTGTWKSKPFTYKISKEEPLEPLEMQ